MRFLVPLSAVSALVLAGCSYTSNTTRVPRIGVQAHELERHEYVVLGNAEGNGCVEQSCILGIWCSVKDEAGNAVKMIDPDTGIEMLGAGLGTVEDVAEVAEASALGAAIAKHADADAVFTPRKTMELETKDNVVFRAVKACVRVSGKSIRIKTDEEMKGAVAVTPPPPPPPPPAPPAETPPAPPAETPPAAPPAG